MLHTLTLAILFGLVVPTNNASICQEYTKTPNVSSSGTLSAETLHKICTTCRKIIRFKPNMNHFDEMQNEDNLNYEVVDPDNSNCANFTEYLIKVHTYNSDNLQMLQNCSSLCIMQGQYGYIFVKSQYDVAGLLNQLANRLGELMPTDINLRGGLYRLEDPNDKNRLSYFKVKMDQEESGTCRELIGRIMDQIDILQFTQPKEMQNSIDYEKEHFLSRFPCSNANQSIESQQTVSFEDIEGLCQAKLIIYFDQDKQCSDVESLDESQAIECLGRPLKLGENLYNRESFEKKFGDLAGIKASETLSQYKALYLKVIEKEAKIKDQCEEIYLFDRSKSSGGLGPDKTTTIAVTCTVSIIVFLVVIVIIICVCVKLKKKSRPRYIVGITRTVDNPTYQPGNNDGDAYDDDIDDDDDYFDSDFDDDPVYESDPKEGISNLSNHYQSANTASK